MAKKTAKEKLNDAISKDVSKYVSHGKPVKQAVAIAINKNKGGKK
jgi:hypothetical protein